MILFCYLPQDRDKCDSNTIFTNQEHPLARQFNKDFVYIGLITNPNEYSLCSIRQSRFTLSFGTSNINNKKNSGLYIRVQAFEIQAYKILI